MRRLPIEVFFDPDLIDIPFDAYLELIKMKLPLNHPLNLKFSFIDMTMLNTLSTLAGVSKSLFVRHLVMRYGKELLEELTQANPVESSNPLLDISNVCVELNSVEKDNLSPELIALCMTALSASTQMKECKHMNEVKEVFPLATDEACKAIQQLHYQNLKAKQAAIDASDTAPSTGMKNITVSYLMKAMEKSGVDKDFPI